MSIHKELIFRLGCLTFDTKNIICTSWKQASNKVWLSFIKYLVYETENTF